MKQSFTANFQGKDPNVETWKSMFVVSASSRQKQGKLYYSQRLYHLQGRNHLGTAGSISGRHDRSTLEQRMDH